MSDMSDQPKYTEEEIQAKLKQTVHDALTTEELKKQIGMEIRSEVLLATLPIEYLLGVIIVQHGIKEEVGDMSFKSKIDQLASKAHRILTDDDKKCLEAFKWTRNRFIHELPVYSFSRCYDTHTVHRQLVLDIGAPEIKRMPDAHVWDSEKRLRFGFNLLTQQVTEIIKRIMVDLPPPSIPPTPPQGDSPA